MPEDPNLAPDPSFSAIDQHWAVKFFGPVRVQSVQVSDAPLPDGRMLPGLWVTTDRQAEITWRRPLAMPAADESVCYRVSAWMIVYGTDAEAALGVYGYADSGYPTEWLIEGGEPCGEPMLARLAAAGGAWRHIRGYVIPPSERHVWADPVDTTERNLQPAQALAGVSIVFTLRSKGATTATLGVAAPSFEAVRLVPLGQGEGPRGG